MLAVAKSPRFATLMVGATFIYLVAILFRLPLLFFMAACLVVAPLVSYALAAVGLGKVVAERRLAERLYPDEQVTVELRIANHAWLPKCLLRIDERLPEGLDGRAADPPGCVVPMLWADPYTHRYPLVARHRGLYRLDPVTVTAVEPFDLFRARRTVGPGNELLVYPRVVPLRDPAIHNPAASGALYRRRPTHDGTDFRGTREYYPGDDLRRVHWRSTARRGKPIVVEFDEPCTSEVMILLDAGPGSALGAGKETTLETAVTVAASVIAYEFDHGNAVGLQVTGEPEQELAVTYERHRLLAFLEALALVEPTGGRPFGEALRALDGVPTSLELLLISPRADRDVLGGVGELVRRGHSVAYAWIDPAGYPMVEDDPERTAAAGWLRGVGARVLRVRRDALAASLAEPW